MSTIVPEPAPPQVQPEPYYSDDLVTLYLGRCEDVLPTLAPVDHIITDPPYSQKVHAAVRSSKLKEGHPKERGNWHRNVDLGFVHLSPDLRALCGREFARLAKRWVLVFSDVEGAPGWWADLTGNGLDYVRTGFWHKPGATPQFSGDRPANAVEAITICHPKGRKRWNGGGNFAFWSVPIVQNRGDVQRVHTTQKPEPLMRALVEQFTDEGDLILDAFGGSGTTALAAKYLGRRCILIEEDEARAEVAAKRIASSPDTLFGGVA